MAENRVKWLDAPSDRTGVEIDILPSGFDTQKSGCAHCGGTLDFYWTCGRCGAEHFPAVQRLISQERRE